MEKAVRFVAFLEATKGLIVLLAAAGLLSAIHQDLHQLAAAFIAKMHLNPASKYPQIFLDAATNLKSTRLVMLAIGAMLYALMRFIEAYGLFRKKTWAKLFAAISGGVYIPFELSSLIKEPSWFDVTLLIVNVAIVALMVRAVITRDHPPGGA